MKFGIAALSLLVVATSIPLAVADQTVCSPGNELCLRTTNIVRGTGTCTSGTYYYESHAASLTARAGSTTATLNAYNACFHYSWGWGETTEYSIVEAQLSTFDSSTWDYDAIGVAWSESAWAPCDTYVFVSSVEGSPVSGKVASLGCPTGDGPGIIFPALP